MVKRPLLLDLFCGAGGCAVGYYRAGFDVIGVDIKPQPNYPFQMLVADATHPPCELRDFDVIHASPPCQAFTKLRVIHGKRYRDLVGAVRTLLEKAGKPYVIENVPGAPLHHPIELCGCMFGLGVNRSRLFECSPYFMGPAHSGHQGRRTQIRGVYDRGERGLVTVAGHNFCPVAGGKAMGIDWMTGSELAQAIPPAYTEYIGKQLIRAITPLSESTPAIPAPPQSAP